MIWLPVRFHMTVFATGFRPFFILAAAFAAFQVPLWVLGLLQIVAPTGGMSWHAHEMLFGFTGAVIAGFLLTAARNWTHRETASGASLAILCAMWLAGRIVVGKPELFPAPRGNFCRFGIFSCACLLRCAADHCSEAMEATWNSQHPRSADRLQSGVPPLTHPSTNRVACGAGSHSGFDCDHWRQGHSDVHEECHQN
jgi:hypothetical protein